MVDRTGYIEAGLNRLLTDYRESENLKGLISTYLDAAIDAVEVLEQIFPSFDVDSAVGEQLTWVGKQLGWPRDHCAGRLKTVFGFIYHEGFPDPPTAQPVAGFFEGEWKNAGSQFEAASIDDDDLYRRFLKSRIITLTGAYYVDSMREAIAILLGPTAFILRYRPGVMQIATGRLLTADEKARVHLFEQVLPVAPGVRLEIWQSTLAPFGFGTGWGGFSEVAGTGIDNGKIFGFGDGQLIGGFFEGSWNGVSGTGVVDLPGEWPARIW